MTWGFVAVAAATVVGGAISSSASKSAANKQAQASQDAQQNQRDMYEEQRGDQAPWRDAGKTALGQLSTGTAAGGEFNRNFTAADFQQDPGYQFRQSEGMKGVNNSAAARGGLLSGAALKATDQYNQNFASNEYQNAYNRFNNDASTRFNRLASISGLGQTATAQTGQAGSNAANNISNQMIGAGNAQAAGAVGQANAINNGISTLGNYYMQSQYGYGGGGGSPYGSSYGGSSAATNAGGYTNNGGYMNTGSSGNLIP